MELIKMEKAREEAPVVLNLIKDTGWCYTFGIVSVVAFIPVFTFQCYEAWRARKEGMHKVMMNVASAIAILGNATWMVGDVFYHDHLRPYVKWIFNLGFAVLAAWAIFAYFANRKDVARKSDRVMAVSKETKSIVFVHPRAQASRRPMRDYHRGSVVVRHRHSHHN